MSAFQLRAYQLNMKQEVYAAWGNGARNVLLVQPPGSGKTVVFSDIILENQGPCCAIAHRQELVGQMSLTLARNGVRHRVIGPQNVIKQCVATHMLELGKAFIDPAAAVSVAAVATLKSRGEGLAMQNYCASVTLWVVDEAHHVVNDNTWGGAVALFPNARGLGVTATPFRADGKGLGADASGVFHAMVLGPTARELIDLGYLTDYRVFAPPSDFLRPTRMGSTGDFTQKAATESVRQSKIIGDIVGKYKKFVGLQKGITYMPDVQSSHDVAAEFNAAGVPAVALSGKTPAKERDVAMRKFRNGEILQLVNADLFGEGLDIPDAVSVHLGRPTESLSLYIQQTTRPQRLGVGKNLLSLWEGFTPGQRHQFIAQCGKPRALIVDHVGNVQRLGPPDAARDWTLANREKRSSGQAEDVVPYTTCLNPECVAVYERFLPECPFCGKRPQPAERSAPEFVDGDLTELDPATLAQMRDQIAHVDRSPAEVREEMIIYGKSELVQRAASARHRERQQSQTNLREIIKWWSGIHRAEGRGDNEIYRRFYLRYGVDMMSAQVLKRAEADALAIKMTEDLIKWNS